MSDEATERPPGGNDAGTVQRTWDPGGVGNQLGDERETSDDTWNPGGVGNATKDEIVDLDDPGAGDAADAADAAGE